MLDHQGCRDSLRTSDAVSASSSNAAGEFVFTLCTSTSHPEPDRPPVDARLLRPRLPGPVGHEGPLPRRARPRAPGFVPASSKEGEVRLRVGEPLQGSVLLDLARDLADPLGGFLSLTGAQRASSSGWRASGSTTVRPTSTTRRAGRPRTLSSRSCNGRHGGTGRLVAKPSSLPLADYQASSGAQQPAHGPRISTGHPGVQTQSSIILVMRT